MMRTTCLTLAAMLLAGCSESSAPATIEGKYPLRTYRYEPLPGMVSEDVNHSVRITGGSITLDGDLTFRSHYTFEHYDWGTFSTTAVDCTGRWTPTETSPQGGQLITLTENAAPGCNDYGTAEWDRNKRLTVVWVRLGDTQHAR
jgi:hypothetical protein